MPLILDRIWPIWGIEKKKKIVEEVIFDLGSLKLYFFN